MHWHSGQQDYESAALDRNRLQAVRALLERQRVANEGAGTYDAVAVDVEGTEANAQVFQVRDGVLSDRQSFYLENESEQPPAIVAEEFILQYYASALSIPSLIVVQSTLAEGSELPILEEILAERRGGGVEIRASERGGKRRILDLAERNARLALEQEKLKAERRRQQRVEALDGLQQALGLDTLPVRVECFDISHLGGTHDRVDGRVRGRRAEEVRLPEIQHPRGRSRRRLRCNERGSEPPVRPVEQAGRALAVRRRARSVVRGAAEPDRDRRRQGPARGRPRGAAGLPRARRGGRLARQADRGGVPARPHHTGPPPARHARAAAAPARARRGAPVRDHPSPDPPRPRDDRVDHGRAAGHRPARKRVLLKHFGSPDAVLAASREELERVPGFPQKVARDLYAHLNKTGR